jgi:hypothetical protein
MFPMADFAWKDINTFKSFEEGLGGSVSCPCCHYHLETIDHLFILCPRMHDF